MRRGAHIEGGERFVALLAKERAQADVTLRIWNLDAGAAQRIIDRPGIGGVHRFRTLHRFERGPDNQFELQSAVAVAHEPDLRAMLLRVRQREGYIARRGENALANLLLVSADRNLKGHMDTPRLPTPRPVDHRVLNEF